VEIVAFDDPSGTSQSDQQVDKLQLLTGHLAISNACPIGVIPDPQYSLRCYSLSGCQPLCCQTL
jgi:hypothetical protein